MVSKMAIKADSLIVVWKDRMLKLCKDEKDSFFEQDVWLDKQTVRMELLLTCKGLRSQGSAATACLSNSRALTKFPALFSRKPHCLATQHPGFPDPFSSAMENSLLASLSLRCLASKIAHAYNPAENCCRS